MNFKFQISKFKSGRADRRRPDGSQFSFFAFRCSPLFAFLWWFRQVLGDSAYENYLRSIHRASAGAQHDAPVRILSREEFFLDSLRRRYSSVSRCC